MFSHHFNLVMYQLSKFYFSKTGKPKNQSIYGIVSETKSQYGIVSIIENLWDQYFQNIPWSLLLLTL